eukprot:9485136-Pyramimonas_sp.AAC.1
MAYLAVVYSAYNEARLIPAWPITPAQLHSCALAGVRSMTMAAPQRLANGARAGQVPVDFRRRRRPGSTSPSSSSSSSSSSSVEAVGGRLGLSVRQRPGHPDSPRLTPV